MDIRIPDHILTLKPYSPGKPLAEVERDYGIADSIKLASNENPLGPSPRALNAIQEGLSTLHRYPDGGGHDLTAALAERLGVTPAHIVLGNGSDEIIGMLTRALLLPGDEAILPQPSFLMYDIMVRAAGAIPVYVPLKSLTIDLEGIRRQVGPRTRLVFICNPNNPTGTVVSRVAVEAFLADLPPEIVVVVDEAYIEFVRDRHCFKAIPLPPRASNLVALRTFSKAYGLAGLRIGYAVMPPPIADILHRVRQPFNTNSLAQAGACAALADDAFLDRTLRVIHEGIDFLGAALDSLHVRYFPTQTNFMLIDVRRSADEVFEKLLRQGVIVRSMASYGYPAYLRVNTGLPAENRRFLSALERALA
jgi:histidinol-phosphate aminotransferase